MDRRSARIREEQLAYKRNQDHHRQVAWNNMSNYYKTWDMQASKYNDWISAKPNETSGPSSTRGPTQKADLGERRKKLSKLLTDEMKMHEEELNQLVLAGNLRGQRKKLIVHEDVTGSNADNECKRNRERNSESDVWRHQQWKSSQPVLREFERKQLDRSMKHCWDEQIKEKNVQEQLEKELNAKMDEERKQLIISEQKAEQQILEQRREEAIRLKEDLMTQVEEMKRKERHADELEKEAERELNLKLRLEQLTVLRDEMEKKRQNKEHLVFLRHQYQQQLKQKTKEIQNELNEDKKLLDQIAQCLEQEQLHAKTREQSRREIDKANALLKEYLVLEKQREKQLEFIFYEEAQKMWQIQEKRWAIEQEARNNLMRDVLSTIQLQLKEKLQANAENQKQLIEDREKGLKSMEEANCSLQQKELEIKKLQSKWLTDIQQQIQEKEETQKTVRRTEMEEYQRRQLEIANEEKMILKELGKMNLSSRSSSTVKLKQSYGNAFNF